jgi:hypothetical protein
MIEGERWRTAEAASADPSCQSAGLPRVYRGSRSGYRKLVYLHVWHGILAFAAAECSVTVSAAGVDAVGNIAEHAGMDDV